MDRHHLLKHIHSVGLVLSIAGLMLLSAASTESLYEYGISPHPRDVVAADCGQPVDPAWVQKVRRILWAAYSSPSRNPGEGPSAEAITNDLLTLKKAGFNGLITYGSTGIMGKQFLSIAQSLGYKGIIMGIWSPLNQVEFNNAMNAASLPIVLGYNIGNEGLSERRDRYALTDLCSTITSLRMGTGKPVATSEDIDTYYRRPELLQAGDWVFAIAHPYWHWTKNPLEAVRWEVDQYAALQKRTDRFIFFKEVGLPSDGVPGLSEANQDQFYRALAQTTVQFAYFEGFDQPSKAYTSVEPHWGIFNSDLSPKLLAWNMMGYRLFTSDNSAQSWSLDCSQSAEGKCSAHAGEGTLLVGQGLDEKQYRAMLSFNTAGLPDGASITSLKLKIKGMGFVGIDPLTNRQTVMVDVW